MNKSKTPADVISHDRGDDTFRRFRYQATYAAVLSLSLLEDKSEISAIYCEQHEDILIQKVYGQFIGIQVKTKEKGQYPFKSYDDQVIESIRRFIQHELNFPAQFEKYIIAANCGFCDKPDHKNNLKYLLSLAQTVDIDNLDINENLKALLDNLNKEGDVKTIIKVLKKIELEKTPGLDDIDARLLKSLSEYFNKQSKTILNEQVTDIKDKLILKCFNASSLVRSPEAEYYYLFSSQSYQKSNLEIEAKKITKETLENIINKAVNQSSQQKHIDQLVNVKFDENLNTNIYSCNPEHFVGRDREKKYFWDFIDNIRKGKAEKHLMCFEGNYGIGKSSLILKLQSESKNSHNKNVFFEPFDTKFARIEDFGYLAIKKAIDNAINKKFIDLPLCIYDEIELAETLPFLYQPTIKQVLNYLKENDKVLVIFFDHFDHLLRQTKLESTFHVFEKLIDEFSYEKTNIVLGFSWTSATSLGLDTNIRYRWEKLTTETMEVLQIEEFVPREAKEFIKIFRKILKHKLPKNIILKIIEKWLEEKCYPFPWLLRRLLTKFYNHKVDSYFIIKNQEIRELVVNMLKDDLKYLNYRELKCLEKIANCESSILDFYKEEIKTLIDKKLIIESDFESDFEYIIRDDILREYILTKNVTLPDLSITYIPKRPIDFILQVFRLLETEITKEELINKLVEHNMITIENKSPSRDKGNNNNPKSRNIDNIISDLRHFLQVEYDAETKLLKIKKDLLDLDNDKISDHLREQLQEHLVIKEIYKNKYKIKPGEYFTRDMLADLVRTLYSSESLETYKYQDFELSKSAR